MLSHKRKMPGAGRAMLVALMAGGLLTAAGCQVRPLYADADITAGVPSATHAALSQISIKPVKTRYGQELRNQLIFLFGRGSGPSVEGRYQMNLIVTANHDAVARAPIVRDTDLAPTAGTVTLTASYSVTDSQTGQIVASGTRENTTSYDAPRQTFAADRAQRDAENRGARELAQIVQLAVAQQMSGS